MIFNANEQDARVFFEEWEQAYRKGEIYGFGLSEYLEMPTFLTPYAPMFHAYYDKIVDDDLGFRANTHRSYSHDSKFHIKTIFDNNTKIQNKTLLGYDILPPDMIKALGENVKILVFPNKYSFIRLQLEGYGLKENKNFMRSKDFIGLYHFFVNQKKHISELVTHITDKCSLRCKDCSLFIPCLKNKENISLEKLKEELENIFAVCDYVSILSVMGGEPLLHEQLPEYLKELRKYAGRIGFVTIQTNGGVTPSDAVLNAINDIRPIPVEFWINNYKLDGIYAENRSNLLNKIISRNISYIERDYGWAKVLRNTPIDEAQLKRHYEFCAQNCISVRNSKLYQCYISAKAHEAGMCPKEEINYIDLTNIKLNDYEFIKYLLHYNPQGYVSFCYLCNGKDPEYYEPVEKAVQM